MEKCDAYQRKADFLRFRVRWNYVLCTIGRTNIDKHNRNKSIYKRLQITRRTIIFCKNWRLLSVPYVLLQKKRIQCRPAMLDYFAFHISVCQVLKLSGVIKPTTNQSYAFSCSSSESVRSVTPQHPYQHWSPLMWNVSHHSQRSPNPCAGSHLKSVRYVLCQWETGWLAVYCCSRHITIATTLCPLHPHSRPGGSPAL